MDPTGLLKIKKLGRHRIKPNICFACFAVNMILAGIPASEAGASSEFTKATVTYGMGQSC